jgi:hypothetical protein
VMKRPKLPVPLSSWSLRQRVCSTFSRSGWSVVRSASLAKGWYCDKLGSCGKKWSCPVIWYCLAHKDKSVSFETLAWLDGLAKIQTGYLSNTKQQSWSFNCYRILCRRYMRERS